MSEENVIYKFRDIQNEYHRNVLLKNELWFASPLSFNDPFEVVNTLDYSLLKSNSYFIRELLHWSKYYFIEKIDEVNQNTHVLITSCFGTHENLKNSILTIYDKISNILSKLNIPNDKINESYKKTILNATLGKNDELALFNGINISETEKKGYEKTIDNLIYIFNTFYFAIRKHLHIKHCGIFSLSKEINSILMWSHYGNSHYGFAVGFYEDKIKDFVKKTNDDLAKQIDDENIKIELLRYNEVMYQNFYDYNEIRSLSFLLFGNYLRLGSIPLLKDQSNDNINSIILERFMVESFIKADDWKYENEYRLVNLWENGPYKYDKSWIKEVVLGMNCLPQNPKLQSFIWNISDFCVKNDIPMYRMTTNSLYNFKMQKQKINLQKNRTE